MSAAAVHHDAGADQEADYRRSKVVRTHIQSFAASFRLPIFCHSFILAAWEVLSLGPAHFFEEYGKIEILAGGHAKDTKTRRPLATRQHPVHW